MLIEIVSNCAFSLELRRKKWQQWFRYNDILNFRMCSKRMKRQKKRIYCSVFIDFVLFLHSTNWICTIHIWNVPKTAPLFFFSFFAKIKANILLATFNPTKQGIIERWQPIKKNHFVCIVRCSSAFYLWTHMGVSFQFVHHQVRHFKIRNGNIHWKSI